jgi:pyruvate,water dikinase
VSFTIAISKLGRADLYTAGGKGANLGALLQAGLPVPGGFIVTTDGYRSFVAANHLEADLQRILASIQMDDPASLESGSDQIRLFPLRRIPHPAVRSRSYRAE